MNTNSSAKQELSYWSEKLNRALQISESPFSSLLEVSCSGMIQVVMNKFNLNHHNENFLQSGCYWHYNDAVSTLVNLAS